jgi:hypothetical protein
MRKLLPHRRQLDFNDFEHIPNPNRNPRANPALFARSESTTLPPFRETRQTKKALPRYRDNASTH